MTAPLAKQLLRTMQNMFLSKLGDKKQKQMDKEINTLFSIVKE